MHEANLFWCWWVVSFPRGSLKSVLGCSRFVMPPAAGASYNELEREQARSRRQTGLVLLDKFDSSAVGERGSRKQVIGAQVLSLLYRLRYLAPCCDTDQHSRGDASDI